MKENSLKDKIRFTGISTPFFGVSWQYNDGFAEKQDVLRELYFMRNKLVRLYYSYKADTQFMNGDMLKDKILEYYYIHVVELYGSIGDLLFGSKYFVLLPIENRDKLIQEFDYIVEEDACFIADKGNYSISIEEVIYKINDLVELFNLIEEEVKKVNMYLNK